MHDIDHHSHWSAEDLSDAEQDRLISEYYARRKPGEVDFAFVHPRVATGGAITSKRDVRILRAAGITAIATMADELHDETRRHVAGNVPLLLNGICDDGRCQPADWFARTVAFAREVLTDPDAKIYVHCAAGINRGPSGAYAVLRALGDTPSQARARIEQARPITRLGLAYAGCADAAIKVLGLAA